MLIAITARNIWTRLDGTNPNAPAAPNKTKPNSPPCANVKPALAAVEDGMENRRHSNAVINALPTITAKVTNRIMPAFSIMKEMLMLIPIVMKNRPSSRPRNGLTSASIWWRYSVSPSNSPAKNAPSAMDSPVRDSSQPMPSTESNVMATNNSELRAAEIRWNTGLNSFRPTQIVTINATPACNIDKPNAATKDVPSWDRVVTMINKGTTARSCSNRIANVA